VSGYSTLSIQQDRLDFGNYVVGWYYGKLDTIWDIANERAKLIDEERQGIDDPIRRYFVQDCFAYLTELMERWARKGCN
jgi:hypothetical protein